MQTLNYWKQFESTGKIEDYLSYKSGHVAACTAAFGEKGERADGSKDENSGQQGARPYAGIYMCNRNNTETDSFGGI